jgi:hypothetical protein
MPLKTEINTPEMGERIALAFEAWAAPAWDGTGEEPGCPDFTTDFEHGQWWVFASDPSIEHDRTFSVVDAVGGDSVDGFSFEEV